MIFNLHKRELRIELKEKEIQKVKQEFHQKIDSDRSMVKKINAKLANGITLELGKATHR